VNDVYAVLNTECQRSWLRVYHSWDHPTKLIEPVDYAAYGRWEIATSLKLSGVRHGIQVRYTASRIAIGVDAYWSIK